MKRTATVLALVIGAAVVAGSSAGIQLNVTRAQAAKRLRHALGARPRHVLLVWADEGMDVALEWTGYSRHARIRVSGGPAGNPVSGYYRGPARAWLAAAGGPPEGVSSVRPPRGHHVLPLRSDSIPVSLVRTLARNGARIRLTPLRVRPTVTRVRAIAKLRHWGHRKGRLRGIWLVRFRRSGGGRKELAWMAVTLHARVPAFGCTPGKECKPWYTSPLASFLDARSGKFIEALTINALRRWQLTPD